MIRTLAGLSLALLLALTASAEILTGKVVGSHDGDTLTLLVAGNQPVKVRLAGIDAPELKQPYGQQAKQALSALAFGKEAQVESPGPDKYGRTIGTVFVGGVNMNAALVSQGMALGLSGLSVSAGTGGFGSHRENQATGPLGIAG